jgi:two-component system capsular synthesis response regulator RcsB
MLGVIRVGVLDEHEVVRYGLSAHLEKQLGIVVAGVYDKITSAMLAIEQGCFDLLLMDYDLGKTTALDFIKLVGETHPQVRLLAFLSQTDPEIAEMLLSAGIHGMVYKHQPLEVCVQAIRVLASGQTYICSSITIPEKPPCISSGWGAGSGEEALVALPLLSQREREVLRLCLSGLTLSRIAELFGRSLKTVSNQKLAAYRKLGVKNDLDLFKRLSQHRAWINFETGLKDSNKSADND